jgi:hypothetical protein
MTETNKKQLSFWKWLWGNKETTPGYKHLLGLSQCLHLFIGIILGFMVARPIDIIGCTVLLPFTAVLGGVSFALSGSTQSILQTEELYKITEKHDGGLPEYVFTYQLVILITLVTVISWAIAGLGIFEPLLAGHHPDIYRFFKILLFTLTSLSIRECWSSTLFSQSLLIMRWKIIEAKKSIKDKNE